MEKTRREFLKTVSGVALGSGLLLAGGKRIAQAWTNTSIQGYQAKPNSIIPMPLWTVVDSPGQGLFTYLVNIAGKGNAAGYVWYIKGPKLNIMVDAGDTAARMQAMGFPAVPFPASAKPEDDPITPALAKLGLTPQDIDIVILTQLHFDHCALAHLFTKAKFVVQRKELQSALYNPPTAQIPFYNKKMFENLNFQVIEGDTKITDGVWVIFTPGHTPGGQSVVVDTPKGRVIIAGLCTIQLNFDPPEPYSNIWPVITPGIHSDVEQSYKSLLRIKTMAHTPVALHDFKWTQVESII
jgi:glyoxylase-like metal-dependent hydrolase (beta-lactamase superfamily II)